MVGGLDHGKAVETHHVALVLLRDLPEVAKLAKARTVHEPLHGGRLVIKCVAQALVRGALGEVERKHADWRGGLLGNDPQSMGVSRNHPNLIERAARPAVKLTDKLAPNSR